MKRSYPSGLPRPRPATAALLSLSLLLAACERGDGPARAGDPPALALIEIATATDQPVQITHAGDGSGRLFIVERRGTIVALETGTSLRTPFLDISDRVGSNGGEQGLLGIAFPPDYATKGYFYADYTDTGGDTVVARFHRLGANPDTADPDSEEILLRVAQPYANHNGGQLAFGPDGYLYIALGDGGSGGDPQGNGQSLATLLGKILRIDVEQDPGAEAYLVPPDNPFVGVTGARPEIWAYGLRNPWRFSFDRLTGELYIADVGQSRYEEIDVQPAAGGGENYGWNLMEGMHCYPANVPTCDTTGLTPPVAEYSHDGGDCSVTGGFVYRGAEYPGLQGTYLYGDFCSGRIRGLRRNGAAWDNRLLLESALRLSAFGEDEHGDLYLADYADGSIYKITLP
ncbi:MAG: PQQ-dependent sugar dehydrogenase [Gammaproteobacteria bacterium]|nr:PQQ-dependent sugar dehydrogenase [Gammaproteobacteria bacterium]